MILWAHPIIVINNLLCGIQTSQKKYNTVYATASQTAQLAAKWSHDCHMIMDLRRFWVFVFLPKLCYFGWYLSQSGAKKCPQTFTKVTWYWRPPTFNWTGRERERQRERNMSCTWTPSQEEDLPPTKKHMVALPACSRTAQCILYTYMIGQGLA